MDEGGESIATHHLNRRRLLKGGIATLVGSRFASLAVAAPPAAPLTSPLSRAAFDAYIYTLPLIESARARAGWIRAGGEVGRLLHMRAPTTPATQRITTPNNDTLNSRAWIDLADGPVRLTWPATGDRYISIALLDMYSNNFAVLGSRTTGPEGDSITIVGPDMTAPAGAVRSPTRWMWILIRLLTIGGADVARANEIQDRYALEAPSGSETLPAFAERSAAWDAYFSSAGVLMAQNPGPATDEALRRRIAPLALDRFDPARFDARQKDEIASGMDAARKLLDRGSITGPKVDGWAYPRSTLGNFGQDYLYRAQIAQTGFAALPPEEAIYVAATGPRGDMKMDSSAAWRLRLRRDQLPPTSGFWSLCMYEATPEGEFRFFDNPIHRYSIGDRTEGLRRESDGSVSILMQRDAPSSLAPVNWLPTPSKAPFGLVFRNYLPGQPVLDGGWRLPPLEPVT